VVTTVQLQWWSWCQCGQRQIMEWWWSNDGDYMVFNLCNA
jgi:hypothetical protein